MKFTGKTSDPEVLGINALMFLASNGERLGRFLDVTGIDGSAIRTAASEPGFLGAVLDFLLADERLLTEFAASEGLDAATVGPARARLPGGWTASDFE